MTLTLFSPSQRAEGDRSGAGDVGQGFTDFLESRPEHLAQDIEAKHLSPEHVSVSIPERGR
jgi:hypothetical protein